jgi:hypothetical protein
MQYQNLLNPVPELALIVELYRELALTGHPPFLPAQEESRGFPTPVPDIVF